MAVLPEIVEGPLTTEALGERYRALCEDPRFENLPGKVEIDNWGQLLMSPASVYHGVLQARLVERLAGLGGQSIVEAPVNTSLGVLVADIAWAPADFVQRHLDETPLPAAPALCVEVASPSNSLKGLREKMEAYVGAGAREAWIIFPQSKRIEYYGPGGAMPASTFAVDLAGLFD
jgi:Uma2 family endonuclease